MKQHRNIAVVCALIAIAVGVAASRERVAPALPVRSVPDSPRVAPVIEEICVGKLHSCARTDDGKVACWGDNEDFQIATSEPQFHEPHTVHELPRVVSLRCSDSATYVLTTDGRILWMGEPNGKVANVSLPGPARDFIIHSRGVCALLDWGRVACSKSLGSSAAIINAVGGAMGFALAEPSAERVCVLRFNAPPWCFDSIRWQSARIQKPFDQGG